MRASRVIVLDTFPLSSTAHRAASNPLQPSLTDKCRFWISRCLESGCDIVVPAIAYYEAVRELERRSAAAQIQRLWEFSHETPDRYLYLEDQDLLLAAKLWAQARNAGSPNASDDALDGDAILAAQVRRLGYAEDEIIVATTNVKHLEQFVPAAHWTDLEP